MDRAVADSSVLIHLAAIQQLELLPKLYREVAIPDAVWNEVVMQGRSRPVVEQIRRAVDAGWLMRQSLTNHGLETALRHELHAGEAAAIALTLETKADVLLVDETEARRLAAHHGVPVAGIIGVLLRAKQAGHLPRIRPHLAALVASGFYLSTPLLNRILRNAGEKALTTD
jgi:predicted nucleic acid-binding protein